MLCAAYRFPTPSPGALALLLVQEQQCEVTPPSFPGHFVSFELSLQSSACLYATSFGLTSFGLASW